MRLSDFMFYAAFTLALASVFFAGAMNTQYIQKRNKQKIEQIKMLEKRIEVLEEALEKKNYE
jgi:hypothetical protein